MYQKVPFFLVQKKIIPLVKLATRLCKFKKVSINGHKVNAKYIMKPYDLITFDFPKKYVYYKHKKYVTKKYSSPKIRLVRGLLHNKRIKSYIYYTESATMPGKRKQPTYLYYFYYYRNLLQTCRMR